MKFSFITANLISLLISISFFILYVFYTTPSPQKIIPKTPVDDEVKKRAKAVETLFTTDHLEESTSASVIANFTSFMNNETTRPYAMRLVKKYNLFNLIFDRVDMINVRCKELAFKRYIFYFISFAREMIVHGNSTIYECRMPVLLRTMEECRDPQVDKLCMYLLISAINFEKGGLCFQGSMKAFANLATRYPYGTIDWEVLSIMSIFADRVDKIAEVDRDGMCRHVDRLIQNRAFWTPDIKTHFAWLHKNIKCHEFDKIDMDDIVNDPNVKEFLQQANEIDSEL